jgi:hypothetical protein
MNRRPQLKLIAPGASSAEAAAVVAAIEQFMRNTAPPAAPPTPRRNPWQEAALREGVMRAPGPSGPCPLVMGG